MNEKVRRRNANKEIKKIKRVLSKAVVRILMVAGHLNCLQVQKEDMKKVFVSIFEIYFDIGYCHTPPNAHTQ